MKRPEPGEPLGVLAETLTSPQNALVKRASSLRQRKFRDREGAFLVEGVDLVVAGLAAGHRPQLVFVREERASQLNAALEAAGRAGGDVFARPAAGSAAPPPAVYPVTERVAAHISTLETPPDMMAVFPLPARSPLAELRAAFAAGGPDGPLVVYADGIGDPGNLGTLLRAAVAFGAAALATAPGSADLYGPKTVRASMGAVFGLPLYAEAELGPLVEQLGAEQVYGLAAHKGVPLGTARLERPAVLVVGAERPGLSAQALDCVTRLVTISLAPGLPAAAESLNAGVAGAIALYEFSRRPGGAADHEPGPPPAEG